MGQLPTNPESGANDCAAPPAGAHHAERRARPHGRDGAALALLHSILRLIGRHVPGFWGALVAFLLLVLAAGTVGAVAFAALAEAVSEGVTQPLDEHVLRWLERRRTPLLTEAMLEITTIGSGIPLILMVMVAVVFLWATKHHWSVYFLLFAVGGGQILNRALKAYIARDRPTVVDWVQVVDSPSFPSGHAMSSFLVYGCLAYLVARVAPTRGLRRFTWALAAALTMAVGFSRMYLGVHYPTDVLGGFLAAAGWILFVAAGMTALRFFAPRRPETQAEEHNLQPPLPT